MGARPAERDATHRNGVAALRVRIVPLDSLRGVAALVVLFYHCVTIFGAGPGTNRIGLARGYLAVDVFFLLSGFVLAHVYGPVFHDGPRLAATGRFLLARLARIYPVHLMGLVLLLPLYGRSEFFSGRGLALSLTLAQVPWAAVMLWNIPAWSISAEWHAYLVFPLAIGPLRRASAARSTAIALACMATAAAMVLVDGGGSGNFTTGPHALFRCLLEFTAGAMLERAYRSSWRAALWRRDDAFLACVAGAVGLALVPGTDAVIVMILPALLLACAHNGGRVSVALATAPARALGAISYSLYMMQWPAYLLFMALARHWPAEHPLLAGAMLAAVSIALAVPVSRRVEYPARAFLRRAWQRGDVAPAAA